jgi:UDP-N-acetylglucosamine 3-dehydrogenase
MAVRYGVIGCGSIAQHRHIPECVANPDSKLVALMDPARARVEELGAKYGVNTYTDYHELLNSHDVDAVVVATPNATHAPISLEALHAGKHVLCEKPMATTRQEAAAMVKAAEKSEKYLMIGLNQRLMPPHVRAKEILASGKLGKLLSFRTAFAHPGPEGWSVEGQQTWFFKKGQAAMGVTADLGVHKVDLLHFLLGDEFTEVGGILATLDKRDSDGDLIELDDNAYLTLKTAGGIVGSMIVSWTNYGAEENYTIIYGTKGVLSIGTDPTWGVIVDYRNGEREQHKVGAIATNQKQVSSGVIDLFTHCIKTGTPPAINAVEGYKSLDVILTAMEAAKQGKRLKIG